MSQLTNGRSFSEASIGNLLQLAEDATYCHLAQITRHQSLVQACGAKIVSVMKLKLDSISEISFYYDESSPP